MSENKKEEKINRKWISIVGFLISILLLLIAIVLSAREEKATRESKINTNISTEQASSEFSRTVNEIKRQEANTMANKTNALPEDNSASTNQEDTNTSSQANHNTINQNTANENSINQLETSDNNANNNTNNDNNNDNNNVSNENKDENSLNPNAQNASNNVSENQGQEQFIKPVEGEIITSYSMDSLTYSNTLQEWMTHRGIDIKANKTTVVKASAGGIIKYIKEDPRYGLSITIDHKNGFQTVYSSLLSTEFVKEGDEVEQGQSIGTVGNSAVFEALDGSHLHFEILKDGEYVNPDIYIK